MEESKNSKGKDVNLVLRDKYINTIPVDYTESLNFNLFERAIQEARERVEKNIEDALKKCLIHLGIDPIKENFSRITRLSFEDKPNHFEWYLDFKESGSKGFLMWADIEPDRYGLNQTFGAICEL